MSAPQTKSAADIADSLCLSREACGLLQADQHPGEYLVQLIDHECYADAVRFHVRMMPPRGAVWWACLCVRHTAGDPLPAVMAGPLFAAVAWALAPTEEHRQAAKQAAQAAPESAAGRLAQAAYHAGGKQPDSALKLSAAAVLLSVAQGTRKPTALAYQECFAIAQDVAVGTARWPERTKA